MTITTAQVPMANADPDAVDVELVAASDEQRPLVERFISIVFRRAYGARLKHFMPYLLSMQQNDRMLAALGISPAREGALFLETYLDKPIENTLAHVLKRPIDRSSIIEVGNLASAHGGGARALIVTLTAYIHGAGYEWAVFTATPQVSNNFAKLGIELIPLTQADKRRLGEAQRDWGSYYDLEPVVVAVDIKAGAAKILHAMQTQLLFPAAAQLWSDASAAGQHGCLWQPPTTLSGQMPHTMINGE